jgi:two-component system sensor histidine kinase/response regulator
MGQNTAHSKILVVEDEENYRQIITMTLQMMGYEIFEAMNGLDGLAAAKMHHPDLILCDVNMPKMDGHELLNQLKQDPEFVGIPFVFLTGNSGPGDMRKGMQQGADDYLTKPFTADELINAVEARLTKRDTIRSYVESQFDDIRSNIALSLPHEFRTPLNSILGFSQILLEEDHISNDEMKQIGGMINKSGIRLHRLLENMVLFGQLQLWMRDKNKTADLRKDQAANASEIIQGAAETQMKQHERPGAVQFSVTEDSVQISPHYLQKIIDELLDNALKFSEHGTNVLVSCERKGTELNITIRDAGRGMSEEQLQKISGFQQFERGYYEQQGAGLGLILAKMLAEIHGGNISVESEKSKGTTVTVTLPVK